MRWCRRTARPRRSCAASSEARWDAGPWVRAANASAQPRTIVVDPRRAFGQPAIAGTGIEARVVAERYRAGESVAVLAADYHVELEPIEDAIRCESREAA